jgi:hypothetical protein
MSELTEAWMRSQQWGAISGNAITVLENVDDFQVYVCNPASIAATGCSWNNVQSTQGATQNNPPGQPPGQATPTLQPDGIKITLKLPEGTLTRERELPRFGA